MAHCENVNYRKKVDVIPQCVLWFLLPGFPTVVFWSRLLIHPHSVEGAHDSLGNSANTDLICQAKGEPGQNPVPTPTLETNKHSFLSLEIVANSKSCSNTFLLNKLNFCCRNYSREETIQGRKLYEEMRYVVA